MKIFHEGACSFCGRPKQVTNFTEEKCRNIDCIECGSHPVYRDYKDDYTHICKVCEQEFEESKHFEEVTADMFQGAAIYACDPCVGKLIKLF